MFDMIVTMKKKESELSVHKLELEETEHKVSVSKKYLKNCLSAKRKHIDIKKFLLSKIKKIKTVFTNVVKKVNRLSKKSKKMTKNDQELAKKQRNRAILGICQLFVVVSITYSSYITYTFVDNGVTLIILVPQVSFALFTLVKAFSKLYK